MPKADTSSSTTVRRSNRLRSRKNEPGNDDVGFDAGTPSSSSTLGRRRTRSASNLERAGNCLASAASSSGVRRTPRLTSEFRRLQRITSRELDRREKKLAEKEQELKHRSDDLEQRILSLKTKEDTASMMMSRMATRELQGYIKQLDEFFTCALCYDVLAAPYSLSPVSCGHTFCALCILKWFFSRLHRACGGWHEPVDCPICRSSLIVTPELAPRSQCTLPFIPNRSAAALIESLVEKLANPPLYSQTKLKKEDSEIEWSEKDHGSVCVRKREKSEDHVPETPSESVDVDLWRDGGHTKAEWLKKDKQGKEEMAYLLKAWPSMGAQEFILMKAKLGV